MKTHNTLILALLCLGCSNFEQEREQSATTPISFNTIPETKSVFSYGDEAITWTRGDRMSVLDGTFNNKFTTTEHGAGATFSGKVSASASLLTVLYPYSSEASLNGQTIRTVLPPTQWAVEKSISDGVNLSAGRLELPSRRVAMFNVGGYVAISLPKGLNGITRIDMKANGGETLAGSVDVSFDADGRPVTDGTSGLDEVSLVAPGDTVPSGAKYYFVANPVTMASGFTITLHRKDSRKASFSSARSNTIRRNKVLNLGTVDTSLLTWEDESLEEYKTVEYSFADAAWPFDEAPGNSAYPEKDISYVPLDGGYPVRVGGSSWYDEDLFVGTSGAACPSITLPGIAGYVIRSVSHTSSEAGDAVYFTDIDDNADYSAKSGGRSSTCHTYRISGAREAESVVMKNFSTIAISGLTLTYVKAGASKTGELVSVGAITDKGKSRFSFTGGSSADFEYGVEYLPIGAKIWENATVLPGTKLSESSGKIDFEVTLPSSDCKARAYAKVRGHNGSKLYGPVWYSPSCHIELNLDFTSSVPFSPSGTVASGSGSFEDPRKGTGFPTAAQKVTDQNTGETSNFGAGYWTGDNYVAYFPFTEYVFSSGGKDYIFKLGVPPGNSDRYLYWSKSYRLRTAYYVITYPVISGFRLSKIAYSQSTRPSAPAVFIGIGSDASCLGSTNRGGQPAYQYYFTPSALGSETVFSSTCRHIFHIDSIELQYIKCDE